MKKLFFFFIFVVTLIFAQNNYVRENYTKNEYRIKMRDGISLFTAVYSPKDTSVKYPILLMRTPYSCNPYGENNFPSQLGPSKFLMKEGYIFVYQDVRGRFMSEGKFVNMRPNVHGKENKIDESTDTYDTIEWLIKNIPNNNGKVGMWGISYPGFYAAQGATCNHPALLAVSPQAPISDWFIDDDMHHHGALSLAMTFGFFSVFGIIRDSLYSDWLSSDVEIGDNPYEFYLKLGPLKNVNDKYFKHKIPFWDSVTVHDTYDYFWQNRSTLDDYENVNPAVLTVGGWYDSEDLFGAIQTYKQIEKNKNGFNAFVMGPWFHGGWSRGNGEKLGDIEFGSSTSLYYRKKIELPFFNFYLKDKGELNLPEAYVFDTGDNKWYSMNNWPPKEKVKSVIYLSSKMKLTFERKTVLDSISYFSNPATPVPYTRITTRRLYPREYMTEDQSFLLRRNDVLTFVSEPLSEEITFVGEMNANIYVSITGTDVDLIVKLIDVYPDNDEKLPKYMRLVRYDIMRGKFGNSYEKPEPFVPNRKTLVKVPLQDIFHTFKKGHKIAIQIQSTFFPFFDLNPQTFLNIFNAEESDFRKIKITVFTGGKYPSSLIFSKLLKGR